MRRLTVIAITVLVLANTSPVVAARTGDALSASGVSLAEATKFRETFGFATDPDSVRATLADPSADLSFGTPLTKDEARNMTERQRLETLADRLEVFVDDRAASFGGLYLTQNTGHVRAYLAVTPTTPERDLASAMALAPDGLNVSLVKVDHSLAELQAGLKLLFDNRDKLGIKMAGIDPSRNSLVVTVDRSFDVSGPSTIVDVPVVATNGEGLQLAACWDTCSPWRGGMHIWDPQFPNSGNCTWGFYGTKGYAAKYAITAGHCSKFTHREVIAATSPNPFTDTIDRNTYDEYDIAQSDAQVAHVRANSNAYTPFNTIIASTSDLSHSITSVKNNSQPVGATVCFFGVTTKPASPCGVIQIINIFADLTREDGKTLHVTGLVEMSKITDAGDSGGPVYSGSAAYGIVTAKDFSNGKMVYSMAANVQLNTATSICISSAC